VEVGLIVSSIIFIYCVICLILGLVANKLLKKTMEDFYAIGRRAGYIVTFLSTSATYHSAFAFLTSVAVYATTGITFWIGSAAWTTLVGVFTYLVGTRLMKLGKARGHISSAEALADFYKSDLLRILVAIIMSLFIIGYIVVQAVGFGLILDIGSGGLIPYAYGAFILSLVSLIYMWLGGHRAAAWTDALQGVWMYIGIILAGVLIIRTIAPGGMAQVFDQLRVLNPSLLVLRWDPVMLLGCILIYGCGMLLPHLWIKFYIARDEKVIKTSALGTAIYLSSYYLPAAMIGLAAAVINATGLPGVLEKGFIGALTAKYGSADAVMAVMITTFLHPLVAGFLLAGAVAAAMSTLDNFLGAIAMLLTRDIYQNYVRPNRPEGEYILVSRILMLVFTLIGWYLALLKPGLIFDIVAIAFAGSLQLLPITLQMVLPRRKIINAKGAVAGFVIGSILVALFTVQTGKYFRMPVTYHAAVAGLIGLAVNIIVTFLVSFLTKPSKEEITVFEEYKKILYS